MYIRRKVFSIALDENGEERLFSTNEVIGEESYLKMFAEKEERDKPDIARGIKSGAKAAGAVIGSGALLGGAAGLYGGYKTGKVLKRWARDAGNNTAKIKGLKRSGALVGAGAGALNKYTLGGAALAGLGYGTYRAYKGKKKKKN